jgi:glycosyltransferase involved in cell wall biosynthesis
LRLLFLNHNVAWRGGFFRAFHWGRYLVRRGHQVTLLTISETKRWGLEIQERDGVRLVKTPDLLTGRLRSGWDLWNTFNRMIFLWPGQYDLVHSVDSRPVCILPALMLKKLRRTKLVIDWLDWWGRGGTITERSDSLAEQLFAPVETFFEEGFRQFADGSVVISSALKNRALSLGVETEHLVQIPFGADTDRLLPRDQMAARRRLGLGKGQKYLGYVGSIWTRDLDLLIKAYEFIYESDNRVKLIFIGRSSVKPADLNPTILDGVMFTGEITYEALQDYIAACDVMWLPLTNTIANRGRWPSKISDYLAAGRPVAATAVGDLTALFSKAEMGILSRDEPGDFARATQLLLARPDLEELGRNARRVAETELSWDILTDRLESLYHDILN